MSDQTTVTPLGEPVPSTRASGAGAVLVLVGGVLAVLLIAGFGAYFVSEWVNDQQGPDGPGSPAPGSVSKPLPPLISVAGFDVFLDALEEETGSTEVVDLTVYTDYAVAEVPEAGDKGRTRSLFFDGTFSQSGLGTTTNQPLDLRRVDPELMVTLSRRARSMVDEPTLWYVIVHAPDTQGAAVYAYASNAYGEGGYIAAGLDGKVVTRTTW